MYVSSRLAAVVALFGKVGSFEGGASVCKVPVFVFIHSFIVTPVPLVCATLSNRACVVQAMHRNGKYVDILSETGLRVLNSCGGGVTQFLWWPARGLPARCSLSLFGAMDNTVRPSMLSSLATHYVGFCWTWLGQC